MPRPTNPLPLALLLLLLSSASAHEHHEVEEIDLTKPVDALLWVHGAIQAFTWLVIFPIGMVLGMSKSRWHVPLQSTGLLLTTAGYILGHSHGQVSPTSRAFPATAHFPLATLIIALLSSQAFLGIYLKLHIHEGRAVRSWAVRAHGVLGRVFPVVGWVQCLLGVVTLMGYCRGGHLGQCLAHYIMGSAFIAYGITMLILLGVGASYIGKRRSQEFFDSSVICLWGIVNTFTEHHGGAWSAKDLQHTMLGVVWWAGGALGIFLSRNNQRSLIPALIIMLTGWAFSAHAQSLPLSSMIHTVFGYTLLAAGAARIVEIAFLLRGRPTPDMRTGEVAAFQYLAPFGLVAGGLLFMSATDEELTYASSLSIDHVTYALIAYSCAFILFLLACVCVHLYLNSGKNAPPNNSNIREGGVKLENGTGIRLGNGYGVPPSLGYERVRADGEVFELGGLDVDEGEDDGRITPR